MELYGRNILNYYRSFFSSSLRTELGPCFSSLSSFSPSNSPSSITSSHSYFLLLPPNVCLHFSKFSSLSHSLLMIPLLHTPLVRSRIRNLFSFRRNRQHCIRSALPFLRSLRVKPHAPDHCRHENRLPRQLHQLRHISMRS